MTHHETVIPGVHILDPIVHHDSRGYFYESWSAKRYAEFGLPDSFAQDNVSFSRRGVLRGLHLQHPQGQGKLVHVPHGRVFDVVVDVRIGSPTFGHWLGVHLDDQAHRHLFISPGIAHGFLVESPTACFAYKCTSPYHPESELGIAWDDVDIAIKWPTRDPILSDKDRAWPRLRDIHSGRLPTWAKR